MTEHRKINSLLPHSTRGRKIRLSAACGNWQQWLPMGWRTVAAEIRWSVPWLPRV